MIFSEFDCDSAEGVVLAHTIRLPASRLQKGQVLTAADLHKLKAAGIESVSGVRLEDGDLGEDCAALTIARAIAGENLTVATPLGGRCNLYAQHRGLALIDRARIDAINLADAAVSIATLPEYAEVEVEQAVVSIKVIPFAMSEHRVECCVELAQGASAVVGVKPYKRQAVALISTHTPGMNPKLLAVTRAVTEARLTPLGSYIALELRAAHKLEEITAALRQALASDCQLILISGASVTVDPSDLVPSAIVQVGGQIEQFGMPVEPGNMLLLAHCDGRRLINLPGCSRSPKLNGLDWLLQRIVAGVEVSGRDMRLMGVGGLIKDLPQVERLKRQRRQTPKLPRIAAIVLAAGRSQRMGERNKMLLPIAGKPMLSHVVAAAENAQFEQIIVVTGHQAATVQAGLLQALPETTADFVQNSAFASGMASSLRVGVSQVDSAMDGAMILLGDMPLVSAAQIDQLIAEFDPSMDRDIVAPFHDGRRGNPVLWAKRYFTALQSLQGDTGARVLLDQYAGNLWDVPVQDLAPYTDVDTPEALIALEKTGPL